MLADSHCHLDRLNLAPFGGSLAGVLEIAATHGVTRLLSVAVDLESWPALARMTEPYPQTSRIRKSRYRWESIPVRIKVERPPWRNWSR